MRISKYLHSCLLVEQGRDKLLFDPGKFSFIENRVTPEQFRDLTAIIVTHAHPDHLEWNAMAQIVEANPEAVVLTNTEVVAQMTAKQMTASIFETGTRAIGGFEVRAIDAPHAWILGSQPPQNTAYLVNGVFLNPGDSFDQSLFALAGTRVLALPIMAPWGTELDAACFAAQIKPEKILPVHDGQAKDFFIEQRYATFQKYFAEHNMQFEMMKRAGDSVEIAA
jgi:L-ascorbate metabolism protein UlaG (beta-lactamase superfamily)